MFKNKRYITRGVAAEIPPVLQVLMWSMIDSEKAQQQKLDYLQVFILSVEYGLQKIIHSQEQPNRKTEILAIAETLVTEKVYVIDDGEHTTMLLASEY